MIDPTLFNLERLVRTLLGANSANVCLAWQFEQCEILPAYMPPFPRPETRPRCVVRHVPTDTFLRYSHGPKQGHFWDMYGDDYLTPELALVALMEAPPHPKMIWACKEKKEG